MHGKDGNIDHKGQAWGLDTDDNNNGLFGAAKVGGNDECYDTNDDRLDGCVGDGPAESLGPPVFREFEDNNPPDETITSDTTYTDDQEWDSLTITNGAVLTIQGPLIINIETNLVIEDGGTLRIENVAEGQIATVFAGTGTDLDNGDIDVASDGTLELRTGNFTARNASDINCGPIENPSPLDKRTCGDTDGGVFVHSGNSMNLSNSIARGVFYGDGNQSKLQNQTNSRFETLLQGALTAGQINIQPGTDVVAGEIPQQSLCLGEGFHYAIPDPGSGLTCESLDVTIIGHNEDDSPTEPAADSTIVITARVVDGNSNPEWVSTDSDTITHTWDGSTNSVTLPLSVDKNSTINIDVAEERGPASEKSPDEDPDIIFTGNSLQFSTTIPDQIASKPSNLAPDAASLALEALECANNGDTTGVFSGNEDVEWAMECIDPSDGGASVCPHEALDMDTEAVNPGFVQDFSAPANEAGNVTNFINRTEDFDNSTVSFALRYPDAGRIRLHARACTGNKTPANCNPKKLITGTSNTFTVRPFGFFVDFEPEIDDGDGESFDDRRDHAACGDQTSCSVDASGDVFSVSGEDFPTKIAAVGWQSADDTDDDGVPDDNRELRDNALTPSFGHEDAPETVDLAANLAAPVSGSAGNLSGGEDVGGFSDGTTVVNGLVWDEVGILDLTVALSDGSYFGAGDVTGRAPNVGRFIPARLEATGNNPAFAPFCNSGTDFTYLDQAFGFATEPEVSVTAYNADDGVTTNYGAAFWKLPVPAAFPNRAYTDQSGAAAPLTEEAGTVSWDDDGDDGLNGSDTAYITGERLTYGRNGLEAPFDAAVDLVIPAADLTDSDGVCAPNPVPADGICNTNEGNSGADLVFDGDGGTTGQQPIDGTELRFGRLRLDDAYGPEVAPLIQRWQLDYWTGTSWTRNAGDTCTVLALASDVELDPDDVPGNGNEVDGTQNDVDLSSGDGTTEIEEALDVMSGSILFTNGLADVRYEAPGAGNRGWIETRALLATDFPHLLADTDGNGAFDNEPSARVTFGIFSGDSEQIYLREVFPAP